MSAHQFIPSTHMADFLCKLKKVGLLFSVGVKGARKGNRNEREEEKVK